MTNSILAIDDMIDNLISLKAVLRDIFPDLQVFTALDGIRGLEVAAEKIPDVILLDIVMPGMDGFQVCRRLKQDTVLRTIPVVFLTALKEGKENRMAALEAGAEGFLSKPIDMAELAVQVKTMLKIRAAAIASQDEQARLAGMVSERTKDLEASRNALLHVLEELKSENEIRRRSEAKLKETSEYLSSILQTTRDGFYVVDRSGRLIEANDAYRRMLGYGHGELSGLSIPQIDAVEKPEDTEARIRRIVSNGHEIFETRQRRKDGQLIDVEVSVSFLESDGGKFICFSRDITDRKHTEMEIKNLLQQKELILKEAHHRVKNNMMIIKSLLSIQSGAETDPVVRDKLRDASGRLHSMEILYDKLYRCENFDVLSVRDYLPRLVDEIVALFPATPAVRTELEIDDFSMSSKSISTIGIIVNELITNSMKYAFKGRLEGRVAIKVYRRDGVVSVLYQDDGLGLPETVGLDSTKGLGMMLVNLLVKQLGGTICIERGGGTRYMIEFAEPEGWLRSTPESV
jgi:PAS domain S-box-containing protein